MPSTEAVMGLIEPSDQDTYDEQAHHNASLTRIASHDHSSGYGVPVTRGNAMTVTNGLTVTSPGSPALSVPTGGATITGGLSATVGSRTGFSLRELVLNNGVTADFGYNTGSNANQGWALIYATGQVEAALFLLNGSSQTVTKVLDPGSAFSTTPGNSGTTNIYWSSANGRYEIQNNGPSQTYSIHYFKSLV